MKINSGESVSLTRPYKNQHHAIWKLLYVQTCYIYKNLRAKSIDFFLLIIVPGSILFYHKNIT